MLPSKRRIKRKARKSNFLKNLETGYLNNRRKSKRKSIKHTNVKGTLTKKKFWQFIKSP